VVASKVCDGEFDLDGALPVELLFPDVGFLFELVRFGLLLLLALVDAVPEVEALLEVEALPEVDFTPVVAARVRVREGEGVLQRFLFPKTKFLQMPVIGPEIDPGTQSKVSKHQPQSESATHWRQLVKAEHGEAGHSKKNQSVQLLGFPPGPFTSPVRQSPVS